MEGRRLVQPVQAITAASVSSGRMRCCLLVDNSKLGTCDGRWFHIFFRILLVPATFCDPSPERRDPWPVQGPLGIHLFVELRTPPTEGRSSILCQDPCPTRSTFLGSSNPLGFLIQRQCFFTRPLLLFSTPADCLRRSFRAFVFGFFSGLC